MERGCRNCMWLYHMVTYNPTAPCSECLDYDKWQTAKRTNADRIRAMTDEGLVKWIESLEPAACPYRDDHGDDCRFTHCADCWLDWLKQEANDG